MPVVKTKPKKPRTVFGNDKARVGANTSKTGRNQYATNTKLKSIELNNATPKSSAAGVSTTTDKDGKMDERQKKAAKDRTKRKTKEKLRKSRPSGVTKAKRNQASLRSVLKGLGVLSVANMTAADMKKAKDAAFRRAAGVKDA